MNQPVRRTTHLSLKERNVVFVGEILITGLLRLTLMTPEDVEAVIELVQSYKPDEAEAFGTRVAYQRLLELLADVTRDHDEGTRSIDQDRKQSRSRRSAPARPTSSARKPRSRPLRV